MATKSTKRPSQRQEFRVAIICALTLEADMVEMILDKDWADDNVKYGKAPGDLNTYTTGVIADQNVVLAWCSTTGSNNAAQVVTGLRSSFTGIRLAFVVGVCGAVPFDAEGEEILLGDCIISTAVVQFDLGRRGPKGFTTKASQSRGMIGLEVGALLSKLRGRKSRLRLKRNLDSHLQILQKEDTERTQYPGRAEDQLFVSSYKHDHRGIILSCQDCEASTGICKKSCLELHCEDKFLVVRKRIEDATPSIHFGSFGSSNSVIKDAVERDTIAKANEVIAFEMEGSGVWDVCPTIVIKAACDYADSHKNKNWQPYAAAVAACGLKAFLQELDLPDEECLSKDDTTISSDMRPQRNANSSDYGTVHRVVANNIYGGVHYYQDQSLSSTVISEQNELDTIAQADAAIRNYYLSGNRLEIVRLSGELLSLDTCYINLALIQQADTQHENSEEQPFYLRTRLWIDTANKEEEEISLQELFMRRDLSSGFPGEPKRLFIQGRAGIGKSTLCKKIVHEFLHQRLGNKLFDRLLWVPLRKLRSRSEKYGWQQLLQDAFSPQVDNWDELMKLMSKKLLDMDYRSKTLFLFDGLDEISHAWRRNDPIYEFLADVFCDLPNLIITSRPQANSFNIGRFDLELETIGFTLDQIHTYIEKCVKHEELISEMKEFIEQKVMLQGLFSIPIQLDAFCYSWPGRILSSRNYRLENRSSDVPEQDSLCTITMLYQAITEELYIKDVERLEKAPQPQRLNPTKIRALLQKELDLLAEFAFQGLVNGIAVFTPEHQDMIEARLFYHDESELRDSFVLERLSFLRTSDVDQDPSKRNYHFLHLTFQEFFAARHFVKHWRANTDLFRLNLVSSRDVPEGRISAIEFLQSEKYNPQLNIFWRFVTGFTQIWPYEQGSTKRIYSSNGHVDSKDVVTFFAQLNEEPLDLLRSTHSRLIMYCSSEVMVGYKKETQALHKSLQDMLARDLIAEFEKTGNLDLARNSKFPERILCDLLQDENEHLVRIVLQVLTDRRSVTTKSLEVAIDLLDSNFRLETRLKALGLICEKSETASQNILLRTSQIIEAMLNDPQPNVHTYVLEELSRHTALPTSIIDIMISALSHKEIEVKRGATSVLAKQSDPSSEITQAMVQLIQNTDLGVMIHILNWLPVTKTLPEPVVIKLLPLLKLENRVISDHAVTILTRLSNLSEESMALLTAMLKNENINVQQSVANVLKTKSHLSEEAISALVAKIKDRNVDVRVFAAQTLSCQSSLPEEDLTLLIAMLADGDICTRCCAARALLGHSFLPKEAIVAIIAILGDEVNFSERLLPEIAINVLQRQANLSTDLITSIAAKIETGSLQIQISALKALQGRPFLPKIVIISLLGALKHENSHVRAAAAHALVAQPLSSEHDIDLLITAVEDESSAVRLNAMAALSQRSSLPERAVDKLITVLRYNASDTERRSAAAVLGSYSSLPSRAIESLLLALKDRSYGVRFPAAYSLQRQSSLPPLAIFYLVVALCEGKHSSERLHQDIFRYINSLHDIILQRLWSYWLREGVKHDLCCYEHKDCLYVWSDGRLHKIAQGPVQTQYLLRAMQGTKSR